MTGTRLRTAVATLGAVLVIVTACGGGTASTEEPVPTDAAPTDGADGSDAADASMACTPLSDLEVAALVGEDSANFKGEGPFRVTAAERAPVTSPNEFFSWVVYLRGDTPDEQGRVYVFATSVEDLSDPGGGVLGADPATRAAWTWGEVAQRGAPLTTAARNAVATSPVCLS